MKNLTVLSEEVNDYLEAVIDWDSNMDENLLYEGSLQNWSSEQELQYLYRRELDLRIHAEQLLKQISPQMVQLEKCLKESSFQENVL